MMKKQVFFTFKNFSALKSTKTQQELFDFFFYRSNSIKATLVGTEFIIFGGRIPKRKKLLGSTRQIVASQKSNRLFFSLLPERSLFKAAGFRNSYAFRAGTASLTSKGDAFLTKGGRLLCKSCFRDTSFLTVKHLKTGKKEKIWKFKSQRSGEILKEPFIDNFLTEVDQIAFGLTKNAQKRKPSIEPLSVLRSENIIFSRKPSLDIATQTGLPLESKVLHSSINRNKVPARSATPKGKIGTKYILASRPRKIGLTRTELLACNTSKQEKLVSMDVKITNSNQLKNSLDTKLLSIQARKNIIWNTPPISSKRNLTLLSNRDLLGTLVPKVPNGTAVPYGTKVPFGYVSTGSTLRYFGTLVPAGSSSKAAFQQLPLKLASQKNSNKLHLYVKLGDYVNCGDQIGEKGGTPIIVNGSGKIIKISKKQIILQKTQPVLYYSQANVHVKKGEWVIQGAPILTLTHQTLVTGDIVQGIPRIEQLFEAPNSPPPGMRGGHNLHQTLHTQIREIFRKNWIQAPLPTAVRQSLQQIQQILVESIQKVYLSQGVLIADKHVEIIVRQMSSKAEVLDGGNTGLLLEELLPVEQIENTNLATPGKKALYAPAVVGLTRSALESDSFISAASFQETTRVLSRDAIIGKSDFLRGLKEKVVIGDLISAGTGLDIYFVYTLLANTLAT